MLHIDPKKTHAAHSPVNLQKTIRVLQNKKCQGSIFHKETKEKTVVTKICKREH